MPANAKHDPTWNSCVPIPRCDHQQVSAEYTFFWSFHTYYMVVESATSIISNYVPPSGNKIDIRVREAGLPEKVAITHDISSSHALTTRATAWDKRQLRTFTSHEALASKYQFEMQQMSVWFGQSLFGIERETSSWLEYNPNYSCKKWCCKILGPQVTPCHNFANLFRRVLTDVRRESEFENCTKPWSCASIIPERNNFNQNWLISIHEQLMIAKWDDHVKCSAPGKVFIEILGKINSIQKRLALRPILAPLSNQFSNDPRTFEGRCNGKLPHQSL